MPPPWESFLRSLPVPPSIDASKIRGNIPDAEKLVNAAIFAHFAGGSPRARVQSPFASEIGRTLRIVELNVWDDAKTGGAESEVVVEVEVTESMCNVYGTMHGGCAATLLDSTTVAAIVLLGLAKGFDGTGVSQSMNVHWHHPAPLGTTLLITTRSVFADGRARLARCEMRDKASGRLVVSGTHAFLNAGRATKL
ncbi:HotDog domain-containing protein [Mycena latifolia]|nr:HotDog domain-containing protein [Mycena latifolia]